MKYFILFIFLSIELSSCAATGESTVEETDAGVLSDELRNYVETDKVTNIMHVEAQDGNNAYVIFYGPGSSELTAKETEDKFLDLNIDKPEESEGEILHVYELKISNNVETVRYFINGEETHVEALTQ